MLLEFSRPHPEDREVSPTASDTEPTRVVRIVTDVYEFAGIDDIPDRHAVYLHRPDLSTDADRV